MQTREQITKEDLVEKIDTIDFITTRNSIKRMEGQAIQWDNTWTHLTDEGVLSWIYKESQ